MATYLITDAYFKEQYPMHNDLDMSKFYSTLLIEQQTTIEDWIGTILYSWLINTAADTLTGDQNDFRLQIKYILVFATALTLVRISDMPDHQNKERIDALIEKLAYLKAKLLGLIDESDDATDTTSIIYIINTFVTNNGDGGSGSLPDTEPYPATIYYWR